MTVNDDCKYKEGSRTLQHYSNCIMNIRTLSIVQGLLFLGGISFLLKEGEIGYSLLGAFMGLGLCAILFFLNMNYYKHFETLLKYVDGMEKNGPWHKYKEKRDKEKEKWWYELLYHHGPFVFLIIALIIVISIDIAILGGNKTISNEFTAFWIIIAVLYGALAVTTLIISFEANNYVKKKTNGMKLVGSKTDGDKENWEIDFFYPITRYLNRMMYIDIIVFLIAVFVALYSAGIHL